MATKTVQGAYSGHLASNTNTWGAAAPASGDTVVMGTNTLLWNLVSRTNMTFTVDGGTLQVVDGNSTVLVTAITVGTNVGYFTLKGPSKSFEMATHTSAPAAKGIGGIG